MYFDSPIAPFYRAFLFTGLWVIAGMVVVGMLLGVNLSTFEAFRTLEDDPENIAAILSVLSIYAFLLLVLVPATIIYRAMVRNTVYNYTILGDGHRFYSDVSPLRLLWISVSNVVVVGLTLGLMLPWAHVRRVRYLANHTTFIPAGSLDEFRWRRQRQCQRHWRRLR